MPSILKRRGVIHRRNYVIKEILENHSVKFTCHMLVFHKFNQLHYRLSLKSASYCNYHPD